MDQRTRPNLIFFIYNIKEKKKKKKEKGKRYSKRRSSNATTALPRQFSHAESNSCTAVLKVGSLGNGIGLDDDGLVSIFEQKSRIAVKTCSYALWASTAPPPFYALTNSSSVKERSIVNQKLASLFAA